MSASIRAATTCLPCNMSLGNMLGIYHLRHGFRRQQAPLATDIRFHNLVHVGALRNALQEKWLCGLLAHCTRSYSQAVTCSGRVHHAGDLFVTVWRCMSLTPRPAVDSRRVMTPASDLQNVHQQQWRGRRQRPELCQQQRRLGRGSDHEQQRRRQHHRRWKLPVLLPCLSCPRCAPAC